MAPPPDGQGNPTAQRWFAALCIGLGLLAVLVSLNGSWGTAYGQTVVTPTPSVNVADPQLSKTGLPSCCEPGDEVVYTIVATNVGTAPATNVIISDTIPAELALQDVTTSKGTVTIQGNYFEVRVGVIDPGEIVTVVARASVLEGARDGAIVTNTADLRSDQGDRQASDDLMLRDPGGCEPPPELPDTGIPVPEPEVGTPQWPLVAGLLLLLLGIVLTWRTRKRST